MRNSMKPVIGICGSIQKLNINLGSKQEIVYSPNVYLCIITEFGAIPLILPIISDLNDIASIANMIDGLFLPGGQDIDPSVYGEKSAIHYDSKLSDIGSAYHRPTLLQPHIERDNSEINLCRAVHQLKKPILGICRGMQLINVAFGGTLLQELEDSHVQHAYGQSGWVHHHHISILPNTHSQEIMQINEYFTSSVHHQGIANLGEGLIAGAVAEDGVIEIIEGVHKDRFLIGIQGHPEFTLDNLPKFKSFFASFIESSRINKYAK